jgi:predicted RNase H-like HicB family nuclease
MIPGAPYRFTIRPLFEDKGRGYLIEFPDLPGRMSDGATIEDAITNGIDAMHGWTLAMRAEGTRSPPRPAPRRHEPASWCPWARSATTIDQALRIENSRQLRSKGER